jgi:hypothetical protein
MIQLAQRKMKKHRRQPTYDATIFLVIKGREFFVARYTKMKQLSRVMTLMHAANPKAEYVVHKKEHPVYIPQVDDE